MSENNVDRRDFLKTGALAAAAVSAGHLATRVFAEEKSTAKKSEGKTPESAVGHLYDLLTEDQRKAVCFDWDYQHPKKGLLRARVENNWNVTSQSINSEFYTGEQQEIIRSIFEGMLNPEWIPKIDQQLIDDAGGYGNNQSIAIFGKPGGDKFEFVMTGRHMTLRCDGNTTDHLAFGGPIFYGHAAEDFDEEPDHPGNVFWEQALLANKVYEMLDGKQRKIAEVAKTPREQSVGFKGAEGMFAGIPISELSADQKEHAQAVLKKLIEPYRKSDQDEVVQCLEKQGGLDACSLAFFTDKDIGKDRVWDNWRLEGPSFVWHFRGAPHVHVWVNVADSHQVKTNT